MFKYKILIAYDGTNYNGWQLQPNGVSIQGLLEQKLQQLAKHPIRIIGAGRTDAGVHAKGQVAHFLSDTQYSEERLKISLNGLLPNDIRILEVKNVNPAFHAQHSATGKIYHYHLWLERIIDPFVRAYRYRPIGKIDVPLLKAASLPFLNTRDFSTFANSNTKGSAGKNAVRTIYRLDVIEQEGGVRLEFEGNGFLYKMVRNIVGTMLEVASGYRNLEDIERLFDTRDRRQAGKAVPPQGLFLMKVHYPSQLISLNEE